MSGNLSDPQALAASTPVEFRFLPRAAISIQIIFFEDAAGLVAIPQSAGGTATITVTRQTSGWAGPDPQHATPVALPVSGWANGTQTLVPGATLQGFALGGGANECIVTATSIIGPGAPVALSYRLHHDGEVRS